MYLIIYTTGTLDISDTIYVSASMYKGYMKQVY